MIVTYSSLKGGVGKTSLSILTATNLAARGKKVLFFDLDPNNSGSMFFLEGIVEDDIIEQKNVFHALSNNRIKDYVIPTKITNVDIVPSHLNIFKLRGIGVNELKKTLKEDNIEGYDYIVIDTAPTYDNIVINAIRAADIIITPFELTKFNITTTSFLRQSLYDDCPEKINSWYLLTNFWEDKLARFDTSAQTQFMNMFEKLFTNILTTKIPKAAITKNYVTTGEKIRLDSKQPVVKRLAEEMNKFCDMLTAEENQVMEF